VLLASMDGLNETVQLLIGAKADINQANEVTFLLSLTVSTTITEREALGYRGKSKMKEKTERETKGRIETISSE